MNTHTSNKKASKMLVYVLIVSLVLGLIVRPGEPTGGKDGKDGVDGVSAIHEWNGTVLTITSESGTSSADLKGEKGATGPQGPKGDKGDTGSQGEKGDTGDDGTSVTVTSVSESTEDGGSNVVTFSDGKTVTIKNGREGSKGDQGLQGEQGIQGPTGKTAYDYAKEGGYLGTESQFAQDINPDNLKSVAVQELIEQLQGLPVFGVVDENNNITVTSQLSAGTYTLMYENEDGTAIEIGTITVGTGEGSGGNDAPNTEIVWSYTTKIGSDGTETSDNSYGASNHIEIVDGYKYTLNRPSTKNKATGVKICYYNAAKSYMSTSAEICSAAGKEETANIPLVDGAKYFKLRVNSGSGGTAEYLDGITVTATKE